MRKLKRILIFVIIVLGLGALYQESRYFPLYGFASRNFVSLNWTVQNWPDIQLATHTTQDINSYRDNLVNKIKLVEAQISAANAYQAMQSTPRPSLWFEPILKLELPSEIISDLEEIGIPSENLKSENNAAHLAAIIDGLSQVRRRYYLDKYYLSYTSADWLILNGNPELRSGFDLFTKLTAQSEFALKAESQGVDVMAPEPEDEPPEITEPVFVHAGDVIGTQGCSGLCTGTHLHFVVYQNQQLIDPCQLLPLRQFIRWGSAASCGISPDQAILSWPQPQAWMISQTFSEFSPLVNGTHGALDLIDRRWGAVQAAHDGYLYAQKRSCRFAAICNDGAARVVTICSQKNCNHSELKTEYWHLDWMVGEPVQYKPEPR